MNICYRPATLEDIPALVKVARVTFCETFTHYEPAALINFLDNHFTPEAYARFLRTPSNSLIVACEGARIIGYAKLGEYKLPFTPHALPACELHQLYVLRGWHGKGVGKRLMEAMLHEAHQRQCRSFYLGVWERNHHAQAFYARYGFTKVGDYHYEPIGDIIDTEWIMVKSLPAHFAPDLN